MIFTAGFDGATGIVGGRVQGRTDIRALGIGGCATLASIVSGLTCQACPDNALECVLFDVVDVGVVVPGLSLQARTPSDILSDPNCP